jgi:hypothetical protein
MIRRKDEMMNKNGLIWLVVILGLVTGGFLVWRLMPEHQKTFWRTFIKQIPNLPGRFMA